MRPDEFGTLASIDRAYRDDEQLHREIYEAALERVRRSPDMSGHRDYVARNMLGFGDHAFHGAWSLLVDAMPEAFRFLEVGVYKGNIVSLIGMLAHRRGKNAFVVGVSPFNGEGERYGGPANEDYVAAVHALEAWCEIPLARRARLIEGRSQDHDVIEACRASGPYDIVFIDAGKDHRRCVSDLAHYGELVAEGGYLVVYHASFGLKLPPNLWPGSPDIARAVSTILDPDPRFRHVAAFGHMRVWTKRANDPGLAAALAAEELPRPLHSPATAQRRFGGTPDRLPDLVMTFASSYSFAIIEPFVASLLNHGRNIHLTVFADNMDETFHRRAEQLNIEVVNAKPYVPGWHVCNIRHKMYQDYLRSTEGKWRNVLLADVRDVVFQADPFDEPLPAPVVFAAEDAPIGTSGVNHEWLVVRYGKEIADSLSANPIVCAGTTIGSATGIMAYVDAMWTEVAADTYDHHIDYDQGSHNYIVWHLKPEWGQVDLEDRIMSTIGMTRPERISIVNGLIMVDGKAPPVVHQWDRKPGLVAFIGQSPDMHLKL